MNRRRFFALAGLAVAAVLVPVRFAPRAEHAVASPVAAEPWPVWMRGTYRGWERPGVPPW
jgi:hypothetical protein